ncbi:hypothetical protein NBRC116587_22580 [Pseudoteredinibacter isoporae]
MAASDDFNNQSIGSGQFILYTQISISAPTVITRAMNLSDSTQPSATIYEYTIRESTAPYNVVDSGAAVRINRTSYSNVTRSGNNTNLDEFTFNSVQLQPGLYYIGVYANSGTDYVSIAHNSGDTGPLLADSGGSFIFAPIDYHMFVSYFGIVSNAPSAGAQGVPSLPLWGLLLLGALMTIISHRARRKGNTRI